jgi:predicted Ser/Thr protein kinase
MLAFWFLVQLVEDEEGRLVELGAGAQAVVYLGLLHGVDVAVKVRWRGT